MAHGRISLFLPLILILGPCSVLPAQTVPYTVTVSRWPTGLGNHRCRVQVPQKADAVWVHIPWRRHDPAPEKKNVLVINATGKTVFNRLVVELNREFGDLVFQAETPGDYFVYYMPFSEKSVNWQYSTDYASPQSTAEAAWIQRNGLLSASLPERRWRTLPQAKVVEFQTWHEFHRFDPMEVIATAQETKALVARYADRSYLLFPEDRKYPIRMTDDLPLRWIERGSRPVFHAEAMRGEFYAFQMGVYAARKPAEDLTVQISDLQSRRGEVIPATAFHAFNFGGTDWLGRPVKKAVAVPQGKVQALWFGVQVPKETVPGTYQGTLTFRARSAETSSVKLSFTVLPQILGDEGVGELWRHARLKWLDSTIGFDDEVSPPYTPIEVHGTSVTCLGREVTFDPSGLPQSICSNQREVLSKPISLVAEISTGPLAWTGGQATITRAEPGTAIVESRSTGKPFHMTCQAKMEADGYINYRLRLTAEQAVEVRDIRASTTRDQVSTLPTAPTDDQPSWDGPSPTGESASRDLVRPLTSPTLRRGGTICLHRRYRRIRRACRS